ncbi:MAG TPA: ornithine carbamoyltransferase [Polyangiales bacterium]|jgi:ornithine carbamoyltransferase|nr:ornithine carbamoyltransferase [Polyangiales bacterium]
MPRHFLNLLDLGPEELHQLLDRADAMKRLRGRLEHPRPLAGKSIGVIMEKASTRTRISFEVGIHELGGQSVALLSRDLQLGRDEPLEDTARVLSRYLHGVVMRTHAHERIETLAAASQVPVINALTDKFHPCQLLADLMTIREHRAEGLSGLVVAWVGDGNNMAHSWLLASALVGFELRIACPEAYAPSPEVLAQADAVGRGKRVVTQDIAAAVRGAHVINTDVWASMGQEEEREIRAQAFAGFCVSEKHLAAAARDVIFLHCLPAHRGEEVEAAVIDGPRSRVWDEAENRLHAQKALLELLYSAPRK